MGYSFGNVEEKLGEAEFFLHKIKTSKSFSIDGKYYFSAFMSAARSVTLAMQACLKNIADFEEWYAQVSKNLREDRLARYFLETRNSSVHVGENPFNETPLSYLQEHLFRQFSGDKSPVLFIQKEDNVAPEIVNAIAVSEQYFLTLVSIVFECYEKFKRKIDPKWYYTEGHFIEMGKSLQDALAELGYPPDWLSCMPGDEESSAWRVLRSLQPPCALNPLFAEYLDKDIPCPDSTD